MMTTKKTPMGMGRRNGRTSRPTIGGCCPTLNTVSGSDGKGGNIAGGN
jgi:hypothetical protein